MSSSNSPRSYLKKRINNNLAKNTHPEWYLAISTGSTILQQGGSSNLHTEIMLVIRLNYGHIRNYTRNDVNRIRTQLNSKEYALKRNGTITD